MPDSPARWSCDPYSVAAAHSLAGELGLHPVTAQVLVRRGYDTPEAARRFLAAADRHDPALMPGLPAAVEALMRHVERGSRIVIHGDYDVDGVCSTAVLARALERLGAAPVCELPSRFDDGYGLSLAGVERQAAAGTDLLVTVDCGITAVKEVARARELGLEVLVTDHHRPGDELPRCTVVHPALGGYPFPELCAAGVAYKLAEALAAAAGADPGTAEEDLDLVALATVCDVVPLVGENRRIVRDGLGVIARTRKPGLRALMHVAACDPGALDAGGLGFRLGPRINAAGRMRRPDAALELLLTPDEARAGEIAGELDLINRERRDTETRIMFAAEAALAEHAHEPAYVLAGEDWHSGVIGIVASRLVERYCRPCVLIALDGDSGRGSGRSISAFDLHAALSACSSHLGRHGGHRMAAGFDIAANAVDGFRRDFVRHAASALSPHDLRPVERVDALAPGACLGLELAEELRRLGPFGHRNPSPTLLLPAARIQDARAMGDEGQHARFTVASGGSRARAVAFRTSARSLTACGDEPRDVAVRLESNEWNGTVEPRLVLRALCEPRGGAFDVLDDALGLREHLELQLARPSAASEPPAGRRMYDRRGEGVAGVLGDLLTSGEDVLVACTEPQRWRRGLETTLAGLARGRAVLASWDLLSLLPAVAAPYAHVFALDPPPAEDGLAFVGALPGAGLAHCGWGPGEEAVARAAIESRRDLRGTVAAVYRALREAAPAEVEDLEPLLDPVAPRTESALALRVLLELSLAQMEQGTLRLADARPTQLEHSAAYRAHVTSLDAAAAALGEPPAAIAA
ncbi:MAG: single-stranded-DNA-specific exonuclease RecJ [Gaiellaceae bacterium]